MNKDKIIRRNGGLGLLPSCVLRVGLVRSRVRMRGGNCLVFAGGWCVYKSVEFECVIC